MLISLTKMLKNEQKIRFLLSSSGHNNNFGQILYFLQKVRSFRERVLLNILTLADKGGRGGRGNADIG